MHTIYAHCMISYIYINEKEKQLRLYKTRSGFHMIIIRKVLIKNNSNNNNFNEWRKIKQNTFKIQSMI